VAPDSDADVSNSAKRESRKYRGCVDNNGIIFIIYNKPTRCNSGSIVFINNYNYALHVSDALCVHHQEHYRL